MYSVGDNGASAEGSMDGYIDGVPLNVENALKRLDEIGGPTSEPAQPIGWAWAMEAPFNWEKSVASHFGGTRNGLIVSWPKGIKTRGELRSQFHHVIDVVPTILEATGIPAPKVVDGIRQKPIEGVSMLYSFDNANAKDRRKTQYFEMVSYRAIYHDGWVAANRPWIPWEDKGRNMEGVLNSPWELYNIANDFSQSEDLAAKEPAKLAELKAKFVEEAKKYGVFPLDPRFAERYDPKMRESGEPKTKWTYYGNDVWLPEAIGPMLFPRGHTVTAELEIPKGGAQGVIACVGSYSVGWSLYVKDGKPVFRYTLFQLADVTINGTEVLPEGKVTLKTEFKPDGKPGGSGTLSIFVNGKPAGSGALKSSTVRHGYDPFEIGRDSISPVSPDYKSPNAFTGTIEKVTFEVTKK